MAKGRIAIVAHSPGGLEWLPVLRAEGYTPQVFGNCEDALVSITARPPELILLDWGIPGKGGIEFVQRIKRSHRIPVILISEVADLQARSEGLANGAVDFITLPVQREELLARVRTTLEIERLRSRVEALSGVKRRESEMLFRHGDGAYGWVRTTALPRYGQGAYASDAGTTIGIAEVNPVHEQTLASQKLERLGIQAAGIAHDIGNILASILAQLEYAAEKLPRGSTDQELITGIVNDVDRGFRILNGLLIARADAPDSEPLDLSALIEQTIDSLRLLISKKATLRTSLARDLPPLRVNAERMYQVVTNLVLNASEALHDGSGSIIIRTERAPSSEPAFRSSRLLQRTDGVRLRVSDTGCGMTDEVRARMFKPFYTTKLRGKGLGLTSVQEIIREIGGLINVESALGEGSTFEVVLPGS